MSNALLTTCVSIYFLIGSLSFRGIDFPFSHSFFIGDFVFTVSNFDCKMYFGGIEFSYNGSEASFMASPLNKSKPSNLECTLDLSLKSLIIDEKRRVDVSIIIPGGGQLAFDFVYLNDSCVVKRSTLRTCTIAPQIAKLEVQGASSTFNKALGMARKFLNHEIDVATKGLAKFFSKELSRSGYLKPPSPIPPYIPGATPVDQWQYTSHLVSHINSLPSFLKVTKLTADFPALNAIRLNNTFYKRDVSFDNSFLVKLKLRMNVPDDFGITGTVAFPYLSCTKEQGFICGLKHAFVENIRTFGGGFGIGDRLIDNFLGAGFAEVTNKLIQLINKTNALKYSSTYSIFEDENGAVIQFFEPKPSKRSGVPYSVISSLLVSLTWFTLIFLFY